MIGAGFSRNAEKRTEGARNFPLWRDIVRPLIDELLPPCPECAGGGKCPTGSGNHRDICRRREHLFADASGASGMMALGDKFEAKKGSARLRAALESAVPDRDYAPGHAHQLLVRLPWADILTTNWDSLLERAVDAYDRSYDTVITVKQIASAIAPRIVKLHGCARSGTDLIFTEESFRTYPKEYAPFVSLVQQSLMENVIVLFGFSGADPNFRAWHGWVRDHLGSNLQPIYMVSLRPTEPVDVNLMAGRLITHIDLSEKWPNLDEQRKIETFLEQIQKRLRNLNVNLDWPSDHRVWRDREAVTRTPDPHDWWQRQRAYPGWLVAPAQNRADLIEHLDEAIVNAYDRNPLAGGLAALVEPSTADDPQGGSSASGSALAKPEEAALIVANALRVAMARPGDKLLMTLQDILAGALLRRFAIVFSEIDPVDSAPSQQPMEQLLGIIDEGVLKPIEVDRLLLRDPERRSEAALIEAIDEAKAKLLQGDQDGRVRDLVSSLLPIIEVVEREARLRGDDWTALKLRCVLYLGDNNSARELAVRGALVCALETINLREIQLLLRLWPDQQYDASSNLRHAAILREIGKVREAYREISKTVTRLRSLGNERRSGVAEASREAWAFFAYADLIERNLRELKAALAPQSNNLGLDDVHDELHERLDELETNRCDPRREMARLARDLEAATEQTRLMRMVPNTAQPASTGSFQHVLADPANTFIILTETVGVTILQVSRGHQLGLMACRLLTATSRNLAINLLLRAATPDDLPFPGQSAGRTGTAGSSDWFTTEIVFDKSHADEDFGMLCRLLENLAAPSPQLSSDFIESVYLDRKFRLLQHLVAGFITRETGERAVDLASRGFELACKIAYSPVVATTHAGWSTSLSVYEAALSLFPFGRPGYEILTKLLDLPIPTESNDAVTNGWPDPIRLLAAAWPRKSGIRPGVRSPLDSELTPLGQKMVAAVRMEMAGNETLRSVLLDHSRRWQAMMEVSGPSRSLIVERRLALIRELMPARADGSTATPQPA